jgi:hypothetical protein
MSHDRGWRAACLVTIWIPRYHFEVDEVARGVTAMVVGSGALLASIDSESLRVRELAIVMHLTLGAAPKIPFLS